MTWTHTILILTAAFLAVFWEAAFEFLRHFLGAQIDLLPALVVYTSLSASFATLCCLSVCGGLLYDSLSANPLGISILPLFVVGFSLFCKRDLILKDQPFAQFVLGAVASTTCPALVLLLLLTLGHAPLLGWGTLWQFIVMGAGGALATPLFFIVFEWLQRALIHGRAVEPSFRPDREIRRGR